MAIYIAYDASRTDAKRSCHRPSQLSTIAKVSSLMFLSMVSLYCLVPVSLISVWKDQTPLLLLEGAAGNVPNCRRLLQHLQWQDHRQVLLCSLRRKASVSRAFGASGAKQGHPNSRAD